MINDARIFPFLFILLCCFFHAPKSKNYKAGDLKIILESVPYKWSKSGRVLKPSFQIKYPMLKSNAFPYLIKKLYKEGIIGEKDILLRIKMYQLLKDGSWYKFPDIFIRKLGKGERRSRNAGLVQSN